MCLIAWNWQPGSVTPLLLVGNRDEFYARPTQALHHWPDAPILGGRDVQAGGTWLGMGTNSSNGRLAALTNYRSALTARENAPSRGELVTDFLRSPLDATSFLQALQAHAGDYNPFNLLVYDGKTLLGLESRQANIVRLKPGIGAVSNANFNTPWPKLRQLSAGLGDFVQSRATNDEQLWALLHNRRFAVDALLPNTGLPLAQERSLSPAFITLPKYGTRACSVVRIGLNESLYTEQRFDATGPCGSTTLRVVQSAVINARPATRS